MKRIIGILLCCLLALSLFGCSTDEGEYVPTGDGLHWEEDVTESTEPTEEAPEQELVLIYYPNKTLNPYLGSDNTNMVLYSLLYQSLFVVDSDYNVTPMLCSRYTVTENMKNYVFYIEEATFSDGTPLTEEDVLASIQAARTSQRFKGRFKGVDSVKVGENGGIIFYLNTAYENFPILLDIPIVKAAEVEADRPLGTGPYLLEQTVSGDRLRRRNDWWCDAELAVTASSIPLVEAKSNTQIRDAFEFENVGLVCANPGSDNYADYRCDYELWDCENGIFLYIACNLESTVFSKSSVRANLTHAIDRDLIVSKYYQDFAHSATLPASPLSPYYNNHLASRYGYDPDKFIQAISDHYLTGATVRILVNKADTLRLKIAREIGTMLEACGLLVEMMEHAGSDYYYYLGIGEFDIYVSQTRLSANMDLTAFFSENGSLRYGGLADETFRVLCRDALANRGNYLNLHQEIMEDGRLCPVLFQTYSIHATRGLLTGLSPSRDNVFYYDLGKTMAEIRY